VQPGHLYSSLHYVRKLIRAQSTDGVPDGQLLGRFVTDGDEAAFMVLVRRHGPMVVRACQRLLRDPHGV
jgi:hypothetical protein